MLINGNITLNSGGNSEVQNFIVERVSTLPSATSAEKGRIIFNTASATYYYNNGSTWMAFATGGNAAALQLEVDNLELALGAAIAADGTFVASQWTGYAAGATSVSNAIQLLETAIDSHNTLQELDDVAATLASTKTAGQFLMYSGSNWTNHTLVAADLSDVTATYTELNQLHTAGATTADFVKLHALTASAADINILTSTTVTSTTLNYIDSLSSNAQTQLNGKQPLTAVLTAISADGTPLLNDVLVGNASDGFTYQQGAGFRATQGLVIGTDIQAFDADLTTVAGFAPGSASETPFMGASVRTVYDVMVGTGTTEGARWTLQRGAAARGSLGLGDIATQDDATYVRVDGTHVMTADLNLNNFKIVSLLECTNGTDAANKAYVDGMVSGVAWNNPLRESNVLADNLSTPPSLGAGDEEKTWIVGPTATGAWAGLEGHYITWTGTVWQDGGAVAIGDQFGITFESGTAAGGLVGKGKDVATVTNATPGSYAYTFHVPVAHEARYVNNELSFSFSHAYTWNGTTWVEFSGPGAIVDGIGLYYTGNTLNIGLGAGVAQLPTDEVGIDLFSASSALILTTNGSDPSIASNAGLHLKLDTTGNGQMVQSTNGLKVTTNTITEAELTDSVAGNGLVGGNGTALAVASASGTPAIGGDTPSDWVGVGTVTVTANAVGFDLGHTSTTAAPGNHTHKAIDITFDNTVTGGTATTVQGELEVLDGRVDTIETNAGSLLTEVNAIESSLGASVLSSGVYSGSAFAGTTFLTAASSITDALVKLDTEVNTYEVANDARIAKMYHLHTASASTTWNVTHSLGAQYCNVTIVDASDSVIIPQSIVFTDANSLVVTFNVAVGGKCVVMGLA